MASADFERAKVLYPSTAMGEKEWVEVFDQNSDIMWQLVGDIYQAVRFQEERERGVVRMGRRPRTTGSLDEVWKTVFPPTYSNEPFGKALADLLETRRMSQRAFAPKVPCHQTTLCRFLNGTNKPDLQMMERIAAAAKVHPSYFVEWRAEYVGKVIWQVLLERPNMGISAVRMLRQGQRDVG